MRILYIEKIASPSKFMSKFFYYLVIVFTFSFQVVLSQDKNKEYLKEYKSFYGGDKSYNEKIRIGDSLRLHAENPYQAIYSNLYLSLAYINNNVHDKSIQYIYDSYNLADENQLNEEKVICLTHLKDVYKRLNLEEKRKEIINRLANEIELLDKNAVYYTTKAINLIDLGSTTSSNPKKAIEYYQEAMTLLESNKIKSSAYLTAMNSLGGIYHDQNEFKRAESVFHKLLDKNKNEFNNLNLYQVIGNLNLAYIYIKLNSLDLANKHLQISSDLIANDQSLDVYKEWLNMIQSDYFKAINAENEELEINREIIQENEIVNKNKAVAIEKVIENDELIHPNNVQNKPFENKNKYYLYVILLTSIIVILIGAILKYKKSNKVLHTKETNDKDNPTKELNTIGDQMKITKEKEQEILKSLNSFEKGKQFTQKNFSLSKLGIILNTNTKYVNYILKKYKNESYPEYINRLRIEYIIQRLNNEPEMSNYKIDHIAQLAGYSSVSNFLLNFKKITHQLPSEFLEKLRNTYSNK